MADAVITDAMRWRYMTESQNNASGFIHLLKLLSMGKGDMPSFIAMTDRIIRSAQAANHTKVMNDELLEALRPFAELGVGSGPDEEVDAAPYRILRGAIRKARAAVDKATKS